MWISKKTCELLLRNIDDLDKRLKRLETIILANNKKKNNQPYY